ncbi:MAG: Double Era-like domain GTPase Der [Thermodesulfobacterium sp.]|uniref:Double Era-like domain GTPase Der n=1 Tax=Candidatus Thermodesulfobacterium syntrophicum TaxID=3060442 RepID=A0AAE3P3G4_9BACT|nr:Double Era-like domain GTPase Der [Candidatus Thermodesulfobacterium syntrophicum]
MKETPKGNRLHIALFGRTNVGKSSFLNMIMGQDVAIISPVAGTTTDVVEKAMELLPIGPVLFLDTAGLDDTSALGELRIKKTQRVFNRADVCILILEPDIWTDYEELVIKEAEKRKIPIIGVINKIDLKKPSKDFVNEVKRKVGRVIQISAIDKENRDDYINALKTLVLEVCPNDFIQPPPLIGDLLPPGGLAVLVVPIDLQAPKGRLILPQVQTIRDALDNDAAALVIKERELAHILTILNRPPDIVVCDSQVVLKMCADVPKEIPATTFSILFSRYKGDLVEQAKGVAHIEALRPGDKVLIAEACTHHPIEDDIGRVKIPRWLRQYVGGDLQIDVYAGRDYPENLKEYKLVIHCGGCVLNRREMLTRIQMAKEAEVPITNYGICISFLQGVIRRTLSPFPAALMAFEKEWKKIKNAAH